KTQNENEQLSLTKKKLKRYYQSQDKLVPLLDDPEQTIYMCYIRLILLTQQQFQQKDKMINNQEEEKSKHEKYDDYNEENGKWSNSLDYSLICRNQISNYKIFGMINKKNQNIVLSQRIAYLWGNDQMWNHQFQYLLHIPLRKIITIMMMKRKMKLNTYD
ncbi:hypothetical protein RFI_34214, partial [Reticulomyxa filosa]